MKNHFALAAMIVVLVALSVISAELFAQATPPGLINYQGVLRYAAGDTPNGLVMMTFRFYDDPTAGTLLWEEVYDAVSHSPMVTVSNGLFTAALGNPIHRTAGTETLFPNVFAYHASVYLAVKVGYDDEMTPRIQTVAAPFAENCDMLDGKHAAGFIDASSSGNFLNSSSTPQTKAEKLTLSGATDYGINASGPTAGGHFQDSNNSGSTDVGIGDYGIQAYGSYAGGYFHTLASGQAYLGVGDYGVRGYGSTAGGFFSGPASGSANVGAGDYGIYASGNTAGGYFYGPSANALVAYGGEGIKTNAIFTGGEFNAAGGFGVGVRALGGDTGGYFQSSGGNGIRADGYLTGGYFLADSYSGRALVAYGNWGIYAEGSVGGGDFRSSSSASYGQVGQNTYKVYGNGAVSFVQNHPTEKDKVIVYAAPEGDEVAVYTRGTAKLVNGEAKVKLGETFRWVTNPDIGLTAHLTPKGDCNGLYADSVSTTELVVKELNGGKSNTTFDYIVYGLRIGFEESSIVQEKQIESYIPSFKDHRERYAKYPELRAYNSLERFKSMENAAGLRASFDLSASRALHDAIHEYDPAADPPVEKLFGFSQGVNPSESAQAFTPSAGPTSPPPPTTPTAALQKVAQAATESAAQAGATSSAQPPISTPTPRFPLSEPVEAGDVLVMDPHQEGRLMACHQAADARLVGVAMESSGEAVPVTVSGIVLVNVDANYAPVRQGDWLTTSPTPGHAMRTDSLVPGTIVGKALGSLDSGTGLIQVLVMLR